MMCIMLIHNGTYLSQTTRLRGRAEARCAGKGVVCGREAAGSGPQHEALLRYFKSCLKSFTTSSGRVYTLLAMLTLRDVRDEGGVS